MASDPRERFFDLQQQGDDIEAQAVRGGGAVALAQMLRVVLEIGATVTLARAIAPEAFGLIGMVTAITGFLALFKDLGLSTVTVQKNEITHQQVSMLFWINVAISVGLCLAIGGLAPVLAWFYDEPSLTWLTIALSTTFVVGGASTQHMAILRRQMRFRSLAMVETTSLVVSIIVAVVLALKGAGVWALVARQIVNALVGTILVFLYCRWNPGRPKRVSGLASMLQMGKHLTGFSLINYFSRNLDDILVGRYHGATALGQYQRAYQLLMVPMMHLNRPVSTVAIPTLSRLADQPERYRRAYLQILSLLLMATMPLAGFLCATANDVTVTAFGTKWETAGDIFAVLSLATITQPIGNSSGWLFISQGRTRELLRWGVFGAVTSIISFVVGLPYGAYGVALSYVAVAIVVRTPALIWYLTRRGPIRSMDIYGAAAPYAVVGAVVYGSLRGLRALLPIASPVLTVIVHGLVALAVSVVVTALFPSGRSNLREIMNRLKGLFGRSNPEAAK